MHLIVVYDVGEERVQKVCQYLRRYLTHIQNSVFEGDLTEAKAEAMKAGLEKIIQNDRDSVLLWTLRDAKWAARETLGREKAPITQFF